MTAWATAVGSWGDTLVAISNARASLPAPFSVLHYGFDPAIVRFLAAQPFIREARQIIPKDRAEYVQALRCLCVPGRAGEWPAFFTGHVPDIGPESLAFCHTLQIEYPQEVHRWRGAFLPAASNAWAGACLESLNLSEKPFILLHPVSEQSSDLQQHWPHWGEALSWLLRQAEGRGIRLLLTGEACPLDLWPSPNLINLCGLTPTLMEVYALMDRAALTVTTSNSLSLWGVLNGRVTVVCCNRSVPPAAPDKPANVFREWMQWPSNSIIERTDPPERFQEVMAKELLRLSRYHPPSQGRYASSAAAAA